MRVRSQPLIVGALLVGVLFAGCASPGESGGVGTNSLTRTIDVNIDASSFATMPSGTPEQMLAKFADAAFEYKHAGATLTTKEVKVRYQTTGGLDKTTDLSKLVSKATIADGQTVRISPSDMSIFSSMVLLQGEDAIASRTGLDTEWLTAAGVPLPIASSKAGKATWTLEAESSVDISVRDFTFDADGVQNRIDEFTASVAANANGRIELQTTTGATDKVTFRVPELTESFALDMTMKGSFDGEEVDATLGLDAEASLDGTLDLKFDDGAMSAVGMQGAVSFDAAFTGTGFPTPLPEDVHFSEDMPYEEHDVPTSIPTDPTLTAFIERIWSLDLVVGDKFSFKFSAPPTDGVTGFLEYSSQVVGTDDRKVGSTTRPTLRVTDHFAFETNEPRAAELQKLSYDFTYWIDQQSYLPVYQQGSISQTFSPEDFPELLANIKDEMAGTGADFPEDMTVTITGEATMQMTQYTGDFSQAAILTTGATRTVPLAAVVFVLVNNLGS